MRAGCRGRALPLARRPSLGGIHAKDLMAFIKRNNSEAEPDSSLFEFDEESNAYAEDVDQGHKVDPRAQVVFVMGVCLVVLYFVSFLLPSNVGDAIFGLARIQDHTYTFSEFVGKVQGNATALVAIFSGNGLSVASAHTTNLFKLIVVGLAGAGLALTGAIYQGAFKNVLVSPSTLGVMTGASFGTMMWVVLFGGDLVLGNWMSGAWREENVQASGGILGYFTDTYGPALISFCGCLVVVCLVLLVVKLSRGGTSAIVLIISGQMIAGVLGAISSAITYYYTETDPYGRTAEMLQNLQVASFWRTFTLFDVVALVVPLAITFAVVMALRQKMMMLSLDEAEQRTLGVETRRVRVAVVALCTLLTAIVVSFCGVVGFVGFLVPHLARRMVGPNFKYLLPAATVLGAIFVLGAYTLVDFIYSDLDDMVGMFISMGGAVVFLVTAIRGKGVSLGGFR